MKVYQNSVPIWLKGIQKWIPAGSSFYASDSHDRVNIKYVPPGGTLPVVETVQFTAMNEPEVGWDAAFQSFDVSDADMGEDDFGSPVESEQSGTYSTLGAPNWEGTPPDNLREAVERIANRVADIHGKIPEL